MSNADKRTVATDALETLGTIIGDAEKRDAIHLAVYPVEAAHVLRPGQHVGLKDGKASAEAGVDFLGIVDPFLAHPVQAGQRFWLVVYPRQIKSLRHVWEHPAFPASADTTLTDPVEASRQWIKDFADGVGLGSQRLINGARDWILSRNNDEHPDYLCYGALLEGRSVPDEFWPHYERVTGETVLEKDRRDFFSCSC
jgi:hypothetical protein